MTISNQERTLPGQHPARLAAVNGAAIGGPDMERESEIAGAATADQIVRAQFDRGLDADQVQARQESVVAALLNEAVSAAERSFAYGYASVVDTYTADFRDLEKEAE